MASRPFSLEPLTPGTPPFSPPPPPNTASRNSPLARISGGRQSSLIKPGSWRIQTTPDHDSSLSPFFQNPLAISLEPSKRRQSDPAPVWWKVCTCAPASVAYTKPIVKPARLKTQKPDTRPLIVVLGEHVADGKFPAQVIHTQRLEGHVSFSETAEVTEFSVPLEYRLRPTGSLAALRAAKKEQTRLELRSTDHSRTVKHDAAERAQRRATKSAAKERGRQLRRRLQLANSGDEESSEAEAGEDVSRPPEMASTTAVASLKDARSSRLEPEHGACRLHVARLRILICITEGLSILEMREMREIRRSQEVDMGASVKKTNGETDHMVKRDSLAVGSLRRALFKDLRLPP